jgi:hypothetical protein
MNDLAPSAERNMPRMRILAVLVLSLLTALAGSCTGGNGGSSGGGRLPKPLAEQYAIDGIVDLASFPTTTERVIDLIDSFGTGTPVGTTTLRYAMANDERHLYIALEWADPTPCGLDPASFATNTFDGVTVLFDNNGDGTFAENEDAKRLVMVEYDTGKLGSSYSDIHSIPSGSSNDGDAIGDGLGKMTYSTATGTGMYHVEFLIPLTPDATGEDGVLDGHTRFNINIWDNIRIATLTGTIGSLNGPGGTDAGKPSSSWPVLPYAAPAAHDQPQLPGSLTGLITFISDHENPLGEIYTFDPATQAVTRVTHTTGLYIDGVSLSHDKTRVAFYAAPTSTDYANYEIYTINTNGTGLTTLTTNSILDGHPAWSLDDSEIVYASFRGPGPWQASLVTMTSGTGFERLVLSTVTSTTANDNDPDWLPDGRIVFKTDRFNPSLPDQVRIAVMDPDGTTIVSLTSTSGTSDHDPTATDTVAVFERFLKGTNYSTDPEALYTPWDIVEARIDGSGERTLLHNGWINWLPVHDPTGNYLVYQRSVGYTDARLMTRDGRDLGRLIPGITRIRYIDWK